jgi:hypothetical protein
MKRLNVIVTIGVRSVLALIKEQPVRNTISYKCMLMVSMYPENIPYTNPEDSKHLVMLLFLP